MGMFSIDEQIGDFSGKELFNMLSKKQLDEIVKLYRIRNLQDFELLAQFDITKFDPDKVYYVHLPRNMDLDEYAEFARRVVNMFNTYGVKVIVGPEKLSEKEIKEY